MTDAGAEPSVPINFLPNPSGTSVQKSYPVMVAPSVKRTPLPQ